MKGAHARWIKIQLLEVVCVARAGGEASRLAAPRSGQPARGTRGDKEGSSHVLAHKPQGLHPPRFACNAL